MKKNIDPVSKIKNFSDFINVMQTAVGLKAQHLLPQTNGGNRAEATDEEFFAKVMQGDKEAFGLLLAHTMDAVGKLNAAAIRNPKIAQHYAMKSMAWPAFIYCTESLNREMEGVLEKQFNLGGDFRKNLNHKFGSAINSPYRQFAYWLLLYMWYVRNSKLPSLNVQTKYVQDCLALPPFCPANSGQWLKTARDISDDAFPTFRILKSCFPPFKTDETEEFWRKVDAALLIVAPTVPLA